MPIQLNRKPLVIPFIKDELIELREYLLTIDTEGFIFASEQIYLRECLLFHLKEVLSKVLNSLSSLMISPGNTKARLRINEIEQRTLSICFNKYPCTPYLLQMQSRFLTNLIG